MSFFDWFYNAIRATFPWFFQTKVQVAPENKLIALGEEIRVPGTEGSDMITFLIARPTVEQVIEGKHLMLDLVGFWCKPFTANPNGLDIPDRVGWLEVMAKSEKSVRIKQYAWKCGSLNRAVYNCLMMLLQENRDFALNFSEEDRKDWKRTADAVSGNIVMVAHSVMPEIRVIHDYTTKWQRELSETSRGL